MLKFVDAVSVIAVVISKLLVVSNSVSPFVSLVSFKSIKGSVLLVDVWISSKVKSVDLSPPFVGFVDTEDWSRPVASSWSVVTFITLLVCVFVVNSVTGIVGTGIPIVTLSVISRVVLSVPSVVDIVSPISVSVGVMSVEDIVVN